jgi:two-component system, OmpR family, sensor kinase
MLLAIKSLNMNKLINITTRYYIILFLGVMLCWSVVLYFVMKYEVYQNIDEVLHNRVHNVRTYIERNSLPSKDPLADYAVSEIPKKEFDKTKKGVYSDTLVYERTDDEFDEYRKLETSFEASNRFWQITVVKPRLESTEILNTVVFTLIPLSILMVLIFAISARRLNKKLWKPFYNIVNYLSDYRIDKEVTAPQDNSEVEEFESLKKSVHTLMQRNKDVFEQQKQFIENASHETQTPLAVIQSQLEILLQMPELTNDQAEIIQSALNETDRLTKLNKTLLLLSKIQNQQFIDKSQVDIGSLARKLVKYFDEKKEKLGLTVNLESSPEATVKSNPILAEVLLGNLIKNAFVHNVPQGMVRISVTANRLEVSNTGNPVADKTRIFERFNNKSSTTDSWGLGLSIVKKITEVNGWNIGYETKNHYHKFWVNF